MPRGFARRRAEGRRGQLEATGPVVVGGDGGADAVVAAEGLELDEGAAEGGGSGAGGPEEVELVAGDGAPPALQDNWIGLDTIEVRGRIDAVPEPSALVLGALGVTALVFRRRR